MYRNGKLDSTHLTSLDISNIIRDVYYDQMNWEEAIRKHLHSCRYRDLSDTAGQTSDSLVRKQLTKTETPAAAAKLVALLRNERQRRNFVSHNTV